MKPDPDQPAPRPGLHDFYLPAVATSSSAPPKVEERVDSGLPQRHALVITGIGLLLSFGLSRLAGTWAGAPAVLDHKLRLALVATVVFYVLLGAGLATFCTVRGVQLTWVRGHVADALVLGLPLGLAFGALAVGLNSAVAGHLASDPNVQLLVGGGGILRIVLTITVTAALAPLFEETLFRGVLAGSLMGHGARVAVGASALAFGVWHMNLVSLRYYVVMGLLLGVLWRQRGLVCSIATHAAFNGVLTLAAVVATTGAGHLTTYGPITFSLPGGWHRVAAFSSPTHLSAEGPAGAGLQFSAVPVDASLTTERMLQVLDDSTTNNAPVQVVAGTKHIIQVPGGQAVVADVLAQGEPGHICQLLVRQAVYQLIVITAGSPGAERDWRHILSTTRIAT